MNSGDSAQPALMRSGEADSETFQWGEIAWIASGALGNSRETTFGKVLIRAGRRNHDHRHPNSEEILHLLSGRLEHAVDEKVFSMRPGDTIIIPRGARHSAAAVGREDALVLVFYSTPERQMKSG